MPSSPSPTTEAAFVTGVVAVAAVFRLVAGGDSNEQEEGPLTSTKVFGLCALSAVVGAVAGAYGGIFLDRRNGDPWGANMYANEMAAHLKVTSAVLFLLKKGETAEAQKLLGEAMVITSGIVEDSLRTIHGNLQEATLKRMLEARDMAARAQAAPGVPAAPR